MAMPGKPVVVELAEFPPLCTGPHATLRLRIVRLGDDPTPRVDVRKYVTTRRYTGWSSGISLTLGQLEALEARLSQVKAELTRLCEPEVSS